MGLIAQLLSFTRSMLDGAHVSDTKVDAGGGDNLTVHHFACPGDDSHPLPEDYVALTPSTGTGTENAIGYVDPKNAPVAGPGEKRIYSRSVAGSVAAVVHLKNDGSIVIECMSGASIKIGDATLQFPLDGVLTGQAIDPFTGSTHFALGNASTVVAAKKA